MHIEHQTGSSRVEVARTASTGAARHATSLLVVAGLFAIALLTAGCGVAPFGGGGLQTKTMKLYYETTDVCEDVDVCFADPSCQIPYISLEAWQHAASRVVNEGVGDYPVDPGYTLALSTYGESAVLTRENGATLTLNFTEDTLTFSDFDRFIGQSYNLTPIDVAHSSGYDENGQPTYLTRNTDVSFWRDGAVTTIDLAPYGIDLVHANGGYYVPAQTMFDLLLSSNYVNFLFNGDALFIVDFETASNEVAGDEPSGLMAEYYKAEAGEMSPELVAFNYAEICMTLDYYYGLKEEKGIDSFDEYFGQVYVSIPSEDATVKGTTQDAASGKTTMTAREALLSGNARLMDEALAAVAFNCIDDVHSKYIATSVYTGFDPSVKNDTWVGVSRELVVGTGSTFAAARSLAYPDGCPGYEEVGDTAYITFDAFTNPKTNYYETGAPSSAGIVEDGGDVMGLLIYATSQIKRDGSPIRNVVLDLSCNSGGSEDAVSFVCAWMLSKAGLNMTNSLSGATSTTNYSCDANLDRKFDEKDTVSNLNLFCLISEMSFSCGNLTPTVLKDSGHVTILGQTSGGGACVVQPMTTATGSFYRFSGYKTVCSYKNGSYYCADRGVEPDVYLAHASSFYDRTALTAYIDGLL